SLLHLPRLREAGPRRPPGPPPPAVRPVPPPAPPPGAGGGPDDLRDVRRRDRRPRPPGPPPEVLSRLPAGAQERQPAAVRRPDPLHGRRTGGARPQHRAGVAPGRAAP